MDEMKYSVLVVDDHPLMRKGIVQLLELEDNIEVIGEASNGTDAVAMANDTVYGLAAYVQGPTPEAVAVGRRLRAGQVSLNYPAWDTFAPFGGYKQSGNGREYADWGIHDFCEVKGVVGWGA